MATLQALRRCTAGAGTGTAQGDAAEGADARIQTVLEDVKRRISAGADPATAVAEAQAAANAATDAIEVAASVSTDNAADEGNGSVVGVVTPGPKLVIQFTCTAQGCDQADPADDESRRVTKVISRASYEEGVVLVRCPCENLHMVADNLGWFGDDKNIEELMLARGETVRRMVDDGVLDIQ